MAICLIVKYLHFPEKEFVDRAAQRKYSYWFAVISLVVLFPGIYFLYTVYQNEVRKKDINDLVIAPV